MSDRHRLAHNYGGWKPSRPDHRRRHVDSSGIKVRPEVDPRADLPLVFDQMQLGSCTANATDAAFEYDSWLDVGVDYGTLSRMWTYWQERKLESELGQGDTGAMGHDAFRVAKSIGICAEADWPYDPAKYNDPAYFDPAMPPYAAVQGASHYMLTKTYGTPAQTEAVFKQVLSNRQTIAFGFSVYESFESPDVARSGIVPMPGMDEQQLGGHEVLLVGYLKAMPNYFLVRNSWGTGWGIGGYFLMPVAYVLDSNLSGDWITITRPL